MVYFRIIIQVENPLFGYPYNHHRLERLQFPSIDIFHALFRLGNNAFYVKFLVVVKVLKCFEKWDRAKFLRVAVDCFIIVNHARHIMTDKPG